MSEAILDAQPLTLLHLLRCVCACVCFCVCVCLERSPDYVEARRPCLIGSFGAVLCRLFVVSLAQSSPQAEYLTYFFSRLHQNDLQLDINGLEWCHKLL